MSHRTSRVWVTQHSTSTSIPPEELLKEIGLAYQANKALLNAENVSFDRVLLTRDVPKEDRKTGQPVRVSHPHWGQKVWELLLLIKVKLSKKSLFLSTFLGPLVPIKWNLNVTAYRDILDNGLLLTLCYSLSCFHVSAQSSSQLLDETVWCGRTTFFTLQKVSPHTLSNVTMSASLPFYEISQEKRVAWEPRQMTLPVKTSSASSHPSLILF